jgi:hypothetical protein
VRKEEKFMNRFKTPALKKVVMVLLLIGFMFMEFPGVYFFWNISEPKIFGLPFIYGYILCWWAFMCVVLFIAYKTNWGEKGAPKRKGGDDK